MIASAETSQNEQMRNVPSRPARPSSVSSVRYRSTNPSSVSSSAMAFTVAWSCGSSGAKKPKLDASSVEASSASVA
jgi:hypothetical protein